MYKKKLISSALVALLALSITPKIEAQPLQGQYPPVDKAPPPVAQWTALVDQSKLPKAPIRTLGGACNATDEFCVWSCTTCTRPDSDFDFCPNKGDWALTYDDGPTNNTLTVLNALNQRNIKGTFFVIGSRVYENPQILKQIVDSGHHVGVHTWSHTPLTTQSTEVIIAETKWTEMAIKQATGLTPKWFRAPQGDCDDRVRGILTQLGYKIAFWNRDTFDWESNADPTWDLNWIPANFTIWVQNTTSPNGFASLEHDAFTKSSSMAPKAMDIVLGAKFTPQSVAVCSGDKQPYVENVTLPKSGVQTGTTTAASANNAPNNNTTNSANPKTNAKTSGAPAAESAGAIKKNSASPVEMNVLLSAMMMVLCFVGSIYV